MNALQLIHLLTGRKVNVPEPLRQSLSCNWKRSPTLPSKEPTLFPTAAANKRTGLRATNR